MSYYTKITKAGLAAITAAMNNNTKVPITYMAFGDGNGSIPEPNENSDSLVNEVYRVGINKVEIHNKNPNWLVCEAIIPSAVGGFNIREVALYDNSGTTMLAVASYPPTYKPSINEGAAKIQTIRIIIQVDNTGDFELNIDPDVVLATKEMVDQITKDKVSQFQTIDDLKNNHDLNIKQAFVAEYNLNTSKGGGEFYADFEDQTSLDDGVTIFVAGNGTRWKRKNSILNFAMAGCTGSGDETVALTRLFDLLATSGGTVIDQSGMKIYFSSNINCVAPNKKIVLHGNVELYSDTAGITISGTLSEIGIISANANTGSMSVTSSAVGDIATGDIVALHNTRLKSFALHRDYYTDGEFKTVKSVNGNVLNFNQPLETSYSTADINKVYKVSPVIADIDGLTFTGHGEFAILVSLAYKSKFNFNANNLLNVANSRYAFMLDRTYDSKVTGGRYVKLGVSEAGTDYGLIFSNCQDVHNTANYCYGGRHGIAVGGTAVIASVPCRRVNTIGAEIANDYSSGMHAADFHGNTADSFYSGCIIHGRIILSGFNVKSVGNTIRVPNGEIRPAIGIGEFVGGEIASVGDNVISSGESTYIMAFQTSLNTANVTKPATFKLQDIRFNANSSLAGLLSSTNLPVSSSWIIDGFELIGSAPSFNRLMNYLAGSEAVKPSYIQITRPNYPVPASMILINGDGAIPNITKQVFSSSGKNSNGSWIKQSDGSMICRHRLTATLAFKTAVNGGFKTPNIQWTFPEAFVEQPTVIAMSYDNTSFSIRSESAGTSSAQLYSICPIEVESAGVNFDVIAIGKFLR